MGSEKSFSHAEGPGGGGGGLHNKIWGRFYAVACSFSHNEGEGRIKFPAFKRGGVKIFTLS